ncbi:outer membrane protein assembly factor BamB family protein [Aquisphaera giovannonii]|nr:PQQ-binding-like beta-propeller repeat protein [Aquisphaera giovannonii]
MIMRRVTWARRSGIAAIAIAWCGVAGARGLAADDPAGGPAVFLSRGGPERAGAVSGSRPPEHPAVRWTRPLESSPGEPLLAEGTIYVGDFAGDVSKIRGEDGQILGIYRGGSQVFRAPAIRGSLIFVGSSRGLTAISRRMMDTRWRNAEVGDVTGSSPLVVGDRVVVAGTNGIVSAIDFDGRRIWQHDIAADAPPSPPGFDAERARGGNGVARPGTPASDGTSVFVPVFDQSRIVAIDLKLGGRRWSYQAKGWIFGEPTVAGDRLFFGSQDDRLYCLDRRRKTPRWTFPVKSRIEAGAAFRDGSVFFASCDGRVYRVDAETGEAVWTYQTPRTEGASAAIYSSPVCTEDSVFFGSFDGHLYRLNIRDGTLRWRIRALEGSEIMGSPLVDGKSIYVTVRKGIAGGGRDAVVAIGEDGPAPRDEAPAGPGR